MLGVRTISFQTRDPRNKSEHTSKRQEYSHLDQQGFSSSQRSADKSARQTASKEGAIWFAALVAVAD